MKKNWNINKVQKEERSFLNLVDKKYQEFNMPTRYKGTIDSMLQEFFSKTSRKRHVWKREVFKRLLVHLYNQKCYGLLRNYNSVEVLHNISSLGNRIVRKIEDWERKSLHKEEQLRSLIRHCFAIYETPRFLESSFFGAEKKYMLWYVQLGKGKSVKELSQMPVNLTSKMAHEFRNAPAYFLVDEALRYAQAIGYGASSEKAKMIAFSRLSIIRANEEVFWVSVVHFFVRQENLKKDEFDLVIDYITFKYREDKSFSMKNRTLDALVNSTREWHRTVYENEKEEVLYWKSSGIKPLYVEEIEDGKKVIYKTIELLNSMQLYDEGFEMQHCVGEYDHDCKVKNCTIFSLQKIVEGASIKRLATIEVRLPEYEIAQAKAKFNDVPDKKSFELIDTWIDNSQVKPRKKMDYERQYYVNDGVVENIQSNSENQGAIIAAVKIILWLLYFIMKMAATS